MHQSDNFISLFSQNKATSISLELGKIIYSCLDNVQIQTGIFLEDFLTVVETHEGDERRWENIAGQKELKKKVK